MTPFIYLNVCRAITVAARVRLLVIARLASAHMVAPRLPSGRSLCGRRPRAVVVGGMGLDVMATLAQRVAKGSTAPGGVQFAHGGVGRNIAEVCVVPHRHGHIDITIIIKHHSI